MFVITEVLGHLRVQRGLQHILRQLVEQSVRTHQIDALFLGLRQQLFGQLPMIQFSSHGIECFGHR
jgi:hypothetical protein